LYIYIDEIPFNTLGISESLYNNSKSKQPYPNERYSNSNAFYYNINDDHKKYIENEYTIIYKIFEKIFSKSIISNICIDIYMCNYKYNTDINIETFITETNKKIYDELIIKLCNLYKIQNLNINITNIDLQTDDIITIINDKFEIVSSNKEYINIFKLDDILLDELNYNNIENINFRIENIDKYYNYSSKMKEYINSKLDSCLLDKCLLMLLNMKVVKDKLNEQK
jgi:hypothetical protein